MSIKVAPGDSDWARFEKQDQRIRKLEHAVDILLRRNNIEMDEAGELWPASPTKRIVNY